MRIKYRSYIEYFITMMWFLDGYCDNICLKILNHSIHIHKKKFQYLMGFFLFCQ